MRYAKHYFQYIFIEKYIKVHRCRMKYNKNMFLRCNILFKTFSCEVRQCSYENIRNVIIFYCNNYKLFILLT